MDIKEFMPKGVKGFQKGHSVPIEMRKKLSKRCKGNTYKKGYKLTDIQKERISKAHIGQKVSLEKRIKLSESLKKQWKNGIKRTGMLGKKHSPETRLKMSLSKRGEKSHTWKGGISSANDKIRKSFEFKLWRESIFKRDNWTCQECGYKGGELHPHHIKSFSKYKKLRFLMSNGITLCKECHKKTDNYGCKNNKIIQC